MRLLFIIIICNAISYSQLYTKITTGSLVNDAGDSRAVTWVDYDRDGDLDLFVTNGPQLGENNFFYENTGDGLFTKRTDISITKDKAPSDGATLGDYNNDGYPDVYVANWWGVKGLLYKNNGDKTFTQILNVPPVNDASYSETASWGDYNRDGFLDLYVCNSAGTKKNNLYKNNGNGSFTKITTGPQVTDARASRNVDWVDYNNDGYPDIFVANENNEAENLYKNNRDGSFTTVSIPSLLNNSGNTASSSWEDIDNDGDWDVCLANYDGQKNYILKNDGNNVFTKTSELQSETAYSFCTAWGDIDNDGDLDLFITNAFAGNQRVVNYLYLNNGKGNFARDTTEIVAKELGWSYGAAFADYDNNGTLDLFVARCFNANENNTLYKNSGNSNHWIQLELQGTVSNRSAIGAIVAVKSLVNGVPVWQKRKVAGQNGYCGQNLRLHFGLATGTVIDSLKIIWPSGIEEVKTGLGVDTILHMIEDSTLSEIEPQHLFKEPNFQLLQNYPNPFNPSTEIRYGIEKESFISLTVHDITGRQIVDLYTGRQVAGQYSVTFNPAQYGSGIYFCRLVSDGSQKVIKMTYLK